MKYIKPVIIGIVVVGILGLFGYWRYAIRACNESGRTFANKVEGSVSEMKTAYEGQYKICMRSRGF